MAVGKKSIMRAEHSAKEMNLVNTTKMTRPQEEAQIQEEVQTQEEAQIQEEVQTQEEAQIHEEKFKVISSIKSDLPDYLL